MSIFKTVMFSAALALTSLAANADNYNFSYTFSDSEVVTGSFSAVLNGTLFNNISNVHVSFNGNEFSGEPLFVSGWNAATGSFDNTVAAVVSTNGALNNFVIADASNPNDYANLNNYFYYINDAVQGHQVLANNFNTGDVDFDSPVTASWNVAAVAAVPEPASYAMLFAGLGVLGFAARRRQA
jgi:hypothetical protein